MNKDIAAAWDALTSTEKREIFNEVAAEWNLPAAAIEKDWWVTRTMEVLFQTEIGPHTIFKGGTSLSKAWNLIDRFSEDIDLALDRNFLGFTKEMTNSQVTKLRKHSFHYISNDFFSILEKAYKTAGFRSVKLNLTEVKSNDEDPVKIEVHYPSVTTRSDYLPPRVLIEIGSRSLKEPFTERKFCSIVGEHFKGRPFADHELTIATVNPERTFLEKIFLLHEEFQQPREKARVDRLSRHLYDIEKMMDTPYAKKALSDKNLYNQIIEHRQTLTRIRGIDYANHSRDKVNPLPPDELRSAWKKDYEQMQQNMIYRESLTFEKLMTRIEDLVAKLRSSV
jgi:Nucleotidyl transferase AbiEii toxin, Type IV TA system